VSVAPLNKDVQWEGHVGDFIVVLQLVPADMALGFRESDFF
jgi:hypothetical protein